MPSNAPPKTQINATPPIAKALMRHSSLKKVASCRCPVTRPIDRRSSSSVSAYLLGQNSNVTHVHVMLANTERQATYVFAIPGQSRVAASTPRVCVLGLGPRPVPPTHWPGLFISLFISVWRLLRNELFE